MDDTKTAAITLAEIAIEKTKSLSGTKSGDTALEKLQEAVSILKESTTTETDEVEEPVRTTCFYRDSEESEE